METVYLIILCVTALYLWWRLTTYITKSQIYHNRGIIKAKRKEIKDKKVSFTPFVVDRDIDNELKDIGEQDDVVENRFKMTT